MRPRRRLSGFIRWRQRRKLRGPGTASEGMWYTMLPTLPDILTPPRVTSGWRTIVSQSWLVLCGMVALNLISGFILQSNTTTLVGIPILLLVLPSFVNTSGDIASVMASHLSTELQLGRMKPQWSDPMIWENIASALFIRLVASLVLSVVAYLAAPVLGLAVINLLKVIAIITIAGFLSEVIVEFTAVPIAFAAFKRNIDPNNILSPVLTSVGDIIGVYILLMITKLLG